MNERMINLLVFAAGAAVGSLVTWKLLKTTYEQIAQEEIDSVKEVFAKRALEERGDDEEPLDMDEELDAEDYKDMLEGMKYSSSDYEEEGDEDMANDRPYVISPDEFGEMDGYKTITLTLYDDGVLTDNQDNVIDDVDDIVGTDSLGHFGEYEPDAVHVRNDSRKSDYEILLDSRRYEDIYNI